MHRKTSPRTIIARIHLFNANDWTRADFENDIHVSHELQQVWLAIFCPQQLTEPLLRSSTLLGPSPIIPIMFVCLHTTKGWAIEVSRDALDVSTHL